MPHRLKTMPPESASGGRVTNQQIYFMLGQLMAEQHSTLELIKKHIDEDTKKWEHIYARTDKLTTIVTWASGVAAALGALGALVVNKVLGLIH